MRKLRINCPGEAYLVQSLEDLPDVAFAAKRLYMDFETTSFDPKVKAFYPYQGHRIAGIALSWDDDPRAYYIPIRHRDNHWNLPVDDVMSWLAEIMKSVTEWANHNIKFDAHFLWMEGIEFNGRMIDTLTLSKCHDSDRFGHDLKVLAKEWCDFPMSEVDEVDAFLKGVKSKDFGDCPADIMGRYACVDVQSNRALMLYLEENRPESLAGIWDTEINLTSVLYDIERTGLQIDKEEIKVELVKSLRTLISTTDRLHELTGREFTNSNQHIYDVVVNQLGLPVISYVPETGNASFNADALKLYMVHPAVTADETAMEVMSLISEYRTESTFKGLFLDTYLDKSDEDGVLHPYYNQVIRTGRMSCRDPNSQQLNKRAKSLIHPRNNRAFLSYDASQIEFRIIVHYIQDGEAIEAYRSDPTTDFHQWVADICGIARSAAKNINFAVGYGAGKKKVTAMLSGNPDVIREVSEEITKMIEDGKLSPDDRDRMFRRLCEERASYIYADYHERLPTLKKTSYMATRNAKIRGYVFNAFGRRRHLPPRGAHKAFNSIVQGCAMDYIKDRMVALSPRFCKWMRDLDIVMVANVHDEVLFEGPIEIMRDPQIQLRICRELEIQTIPFRVPFIWAGGYSETTWAEACGDDVVFSRDGEVLKENLKTYEKKEGDQWIAGAIDYQELKIAA